MRILRRTVLVSVLGLLLISNQSIGPNSAIPIEDGFAFEYGSTYNVQFTDFYVTEMLNNTILSSIDASNESLLSPMQVIVLDVNRIGDSNFLDAPSANISYAMEFENQTYNPPDGFTLGEINTDGWFDLFVIGILVSAFSVGFFDPTTEDFSLPSNDTSEDDGINGIFPIFTSSNQSTYDGLWQNYLENDLDPDLSGSSEIGYSFFNQSVISEPKFNGLLISESYFFNQLENVSKTFEMSLASNITLWGNVSNVPYYANAYFDYQGFVNYGLGHVENLNFQLKTEMRVGDAIKSLEMRIGVKSQYIGISDITKYTDPANYTPPTSSSTITTSIYYPTTTYTSTYVTSTYSSTYTSTPVDTSTSTDTSIPTSTSTRIVTSADTTPDLPLGNETTTSENDTSDSIAAPTVNFYIMPVISGFVILNVVRKKIIKKI